MAVLPREASYGEFCAYVTGLNGSKSDAELLDLWEWRQKVLTVRVDTKRGWRAAKLTDDEQHLSRREIDTKRFAEAKSQGRNVEPLPAKATF
tara:strand:+ start:117 stop:392 length:276 start_codon:yes stop_codon:yes gene_type:complete